MVKLLLFLCLSVLPWLSPCGEIRAVWEQSGKGLYPGDWPHTFRVLKASGVTDLFVSVGGIDYAHYGSKVLPQSMTFKTSGDQLAACLAASRGTGVRVHAWLMCFHATRPSPAQCSAFERKGWCLKDPSGKWLMYLDPSNPDIRWTMLKAIDELVRTYPVDGIHLDFVRWYEKPDAAKMAPSVWKRFVSEVKTPTERGFLRWRAGKIASFVTAARSRVKSARPKSIYSVATLAIYPSCIDSVGQDWKSWLASGMVDMIVPMNYTDDFAKYSSLVAVQAQMPDASHRVVSGIGANATGLNLTSAQVVRQVRRARQAGLAGFALFDLDSRLVGNILPMVR